jgi:hypothetical protein
MLCPKLSGGSTRRHNGQPGLASCLVESAVVGDEGVALVAEGKRRGQMDRIESAQRPGLELSGCAREFVVELNQFHSAQNKLDLLIGSPVFVPPHRATELDRGDPTHEHCASREKFS